MTKPRRRPARASPSPTPPKTPSSNPPSQGKRPRRRRRRSNQPQKPSLPPSSLQRAFRRLALLGGLLFVFGLVPLFGWSLAPGPGAGKPFTLVVPAAVKPAELSALLVTRGALASPNLFRLYRLVFHPRFELTPGEHLLNDAASPRELMFRLEHSNQRASVRVTLPEGFQSVQIGERLERAEVCSLSAFRRAVTDPALLRELGITGPSAEGYLFPARYGFLVDSDARAVVRVLVSEGQKRLTKVLDAHPDALAKLTAEFGFHECDVLTLASIIEKEAHDPKERPLIASVFFNRLRDPDFRPVRMLQSDPTASYGCIVAGPDIPSCAGFKGGVTPALLRDAANPYNTYRHAGLPPGPIANPSEGAIEAVLAPAVTDYLYFVAKGGGRHVFSHTFAQHRDAIVGAH